MLGIIVAMDTELSKEFKTNRDCFIHMSDNRKFYIYEIKHQSVVLCFSGIGKVNAASATAYLIKTFNITHIINIGTVGTHIPNINIFDILLINKCYYLDVDVTSFNYELGQVPKEKPFFGLSNSLNQNLIDLFNEHGVFYKLKNLGTSDWFIDRNNYLKFKNKNFELVSCFDMELTAIAQVCSKSNVKLSGIKIVSDNLNNMKISSEQFDSTLVKISSKLTEILFLILDSNILSTNKES